MKDRRALYGILIFAGLLVVCLGFALLVASDSLTGISLGDDSPRVGVVRINDMITGSTATKGIEALRYFRQDEDIVAVVVRIDSPGGMVGPSQELYREIQRTRKKKPVVASMGALAASGGYYIAAACEKIVASPGTITGSIGVITQTTHVSELLALAKVETNTFKTGKFKDTGSPLRAMNEEDRTFLKQFIDEIYQQFVEDVAKGRKLDVAAVKQVADGRIFTGRQAKASKLVDQLGNYSDALDTAAKLAKAEGEPKPVLYRHRKGLLSELMDEAARTATQRLRSSLTPRTTIELRAPGLR